MTTLQIVPCSVCGGTGTELAHIQVAHIERERTNQLATQSLKSAKRDAYNEALDAAIHALETEYGDDQPTLGIAAIRALKRS